MILFRIVGTDPPQVRHFTSKLALGLVDARADAETKRLESGISTYRTVSQARRKARAFPFLGGYIARVELPGTGPFVVERTTASAGHHTVWGNPAELLAYVVAVEPVQR